MATATAVAPPGSMTPEEELELLIAEQQADDEQTIVRTGNGHDVSLDAIGEDLLGRDPWELVDGCIGAELDPAEIAHRGDLVDHASQGLTLADPRSVPHGTNGGYQNHKCRCVACKSAYAEWRREYRARRAS